MKKSPKTMPDEKDEQDELMRISKAAQQAGVSRQSVEYYVMLGLVVPIRNKNGRGRYFNAALVKRIKLIHDMNKKSGYTLRDIRETFLRNR